MKSLSLFDGITFSLVFALTLAAVAWGRRKLAHQNDSTENAAELLVMGRRITLPLFVASLVSSWYGGLTGVTALTYEKGLFNFLTQGVFWYATYLIFALVLIPRMPKQLASTFPDMIKNHIGPKAHSLTAVLNVVSVLPIAYVLSLGILIRFLTGWELFPSSALGLVFIFSYSLSGGLRNVVFAEVVQFGAMFVAVAMVPLFSMIKYGSPSQLPALLPADHMSLTGGQKISEIFIWGFIAAATLVDPLFYQRTLAAESKKTAAKGILIATVIWFFIDCCTTLGALYARAYLPNVESNDSYLLFSMSLLPSGLRGLFLAGVFAAVVSTLDANLFSSASIFSFDVLKKEKFDKRRLQKTMLFTGLLSLVVVPLFKGNVAQVWKVLGSFSSACLIFPWLLMVLFAKQKNEFRFLVSVSSGLFLMILGGVLNFFDIVTLDAFYFGLSGSILGFLISFAFKKR